MVSDLSPVFFQTPHLWTVLAGLFCGAALSRATRPAVRARRRSGDRERARTVKWTFFTLYLSLTVVALLGAVFIPGPDRLLNVEGKFQVGLLYLFAGSTSLFFLLFRFRKTAGLLIVILAVAFTVTLLAFLQSLNAYTGETEIARVRILDMREGRMKLEILPGDGQPLIVELEGRYFAPVVRVVIFDDYAVFLGAKSWYRLDGIKSFERIRTSEGTDFHALDTHLLPPPARFVDRIWDFLEIHGDRIPTIKSVQIEVDLKRVRRSRELTVYSLLIQNDGGLQIVEVY